MRTLSRFLLSDLEQNQKKNHDRCRIEHEMNATQMDSCTMNGIALQHILNVYVNKMNFRKYEWCVCIYKKKQFNFDSFRVSTKMQRDSIAWGSFKRLICGILRCLLGGAINKHQQLISLFKPKFLYGSCNVCVVVGHFVINHKYIQILAFARPTQFTLKRNQRRKNNQTKTCPKKCDVQNRRNWMNPNRSNALKLMKHLKKKCTQCSKYTNSNSSARYSNRDLRRFFM